MEIKSIRQLLFLKSGEKVSMYQKYGYEYRLFSLLNFPGAAILNFYVQWLLHCCIQKERLVLTIAATILRHKNSRGWLAGNLNAKTADIFGTMKLSFHFLEI